MIRFEHLIILPVLVSTLSFGAPGKRGLHVPGFGAISSCKVRILAASVVTFGALWMVAEPTLEESQKVAFGEAVYKRHKGYWDKANEGPLDRYLAILDTVSSRNIETPLQRAILQNGLYPRFGRRFYSYFGRPWSERECFLAWVSKNYPDEIGRTLAKVGRADLKSPELYLRLREIWGEAVPGYHPYLTVEQKFELIKKLVNSGVSDQQRFGLLAIESAEHALFFEPEASSSHSRDMAQILYLFRKKPGCIVPAEESITSFEEWHSQIDP